MIFKEGQLHYKAFIDELNRHMKTDFTIPLPVDENGKIAWDYMDSYMRNAEKLCQGNIHALRPAVLCGNTDIAGNRIN